MSEGAPHDEGVAGDDADARPTVAEPAVVEARAELRAQASSIPPLTTSESRTGTSAPSAAKSIATTIGSPLEALERDEILRTRWFCFVALGLAFAGGSAIPLVPGDPTATLMLGSSVLFTIIGVAFLYPRTADPTKFRRKSTGLGFFLPAVSAALAIPYFGAFSPAAVLLILGVYFTGLGSSKRLAGAVYAFCALGQAATGALVILGITRDTGLVQVGTIGLRAQWLIQGLIQIVMLATFITARMSRRSALLAVGELERAVRYAAHREALLLEAREELERALRAGRGRFSNQAIGGYELGEVIGRGAMGEVYAATDGKGGSVAIKLLSQASLGNLQHVQRFFRELKTAAGIHSPNVVHVIEVGENPVPYLVMERLDGKSLSEILRGRRALSLEKVVDLVRQVGAGISAAAETGVIHRDLKPQNLFLHHGTWKILDFGVSRLAEHGDTLTSGQVVGTPSYMAPEQARGAAVDHRTDLYALAAVAYRSLTGHPPHAAGEIAETLYRVVHTAPRRPSELAKVPEDVDLVLAIGLAKLSDRRFATAFELSDALARAVDGTLPEPIRERARALEQNGAWAERRTVSS